MGMMVAITAKSRIPAIAEVTLISPNPTLESMVMVNLFKQESNKHKPKLLRYFFKAEQFAEIKISDIILYNFELTKMGALQKSTRDFLTVQFANQENNM